jgi:ATP-dependent DNA helicase RecQ
LGHETEKVLKFNHQKLSTFGIGKTLKEAQWRSVIRQLIVRGLLSVDVENFGSLRLTDNCRPILRGEQDIFLRKDNLKEAAKSKKKARKGAVKPEDNDLWEALRACRKDLADENNIPPYMVFHDATLKAMLEARPMSRIELLTVSGVGESKLEKYGHEFIEVICRHAELEVSG